MIKAKNIGVLSDGKIPTKARKKGSRVFASEDLRVLRLTSELVDLRTAKAARMLAGASNSEVGASLYQIKTPTDRVVLLRTVFKNTVYLGRVMPCFACVTTKTVLVRKIDKA